ncbi:hypothetical protein D3C80_1478820 [compost metagenome]
MIAFLIPFALFLLCFVKKLTVIGIIGKTQGVSNAANPEKKAIKKIDNNPFLGSSTGLTTVSFFGASFLISLKDCTSPPLTFFISNSKYLFCWMQTSLQT